MGKRKQAETPAGKGKKKKKAPALTTKKMPKIISPNKLKLEMKDRKAMRPFQLLRDAGLDDVRDLLKTKKLQRSRPRLLMSCETQRVFRCTSIRQPVSRQPVAGRHCKCCAGCVQGAGCKQGGQVAKFPKRKLRKQKSLNVKNEKLHSEKRGKHTYIYSF